MDAPRCFARACGPARSRSAWGAAAPRRFAPLRGLAPSPGGLRPGSRGRKGPTRAACLGAASRALGISGCARRPAGPSSLGFSGRPFAPLRVLPGRGPCPCPRPLRARRARFARLAALSPRSPARPLVRRCAAPRALAGPAAAGPRPRCAAGSLLGRPCCAWPWALCSAWPRGGSLAPPPGQGSRSLRPGPPAALAGRFPPSGGPGLGWLRAAACGRLLRLAGGVAVVVGLSPAPPRPAAPAGGSGERVARLGEGPAGPRRGSAFRSPFPAAPPGMGGPRAAFRRG